MYGWGAEGQLGLGNSENENRSRFPSLPYSFRPRFVSFFEVQPNLILLDHVLVLN